MSHSILVCASYAPSLRNFRGSLLTTLVKHQLKVYAAAPNIYDDSRTSTWLRKQEVSPCEIRLSRTGLSPFSDSLTLIALTKLLLKLRPSFYLGYTIKPVIWGVLAAWLANVPNRVAIITGLGYAFTGESSGKRRFIQWMAKGLYKFALKRSTLIFFQNPDDREEFSRLGLIPDNVTVKVVNGSGIDLEAFPVTPFPEKPLTFLLIARLLGDKGIREYVSAAENIKQDHPSIQFHLVGGLDPNPDGIAESEVIQWQKQGIINWQGELFDVKPAITNSHVYVLPSYREGTPRTVLEAMSMGRPIVTTDAPGCRETVVEGENGFKVSVRSVDALVAAMRRFIESPDLIEKMGEKSRQIAEEKYDVHKVNKVMLETMGIK